MTTTNIYYSYDVPNLTIGDRFLTRRNRVWEIAIIEYNAIKLVTPGNPASAYWTNAYDIGTYLSDKHWNRLPSANPVEKHDND